MDSQSAARYRSGFVAVMGKPNVGKSTLINVLLGQKIAAVSPRPQTTRKRQMGILTLEEAQIIFEDTPGLHRARHKLGENMNQEAQDALEGADVILMVTDASQEPGEEDQMLAGLIHTSKRSVPLILVLNKVDRLSESELQSQREKYQALLLIADVLPVSATRGDNLVELTAKILDMLPAADPYFPADQVTDLYEREIAADLIREAALIHLRDEVPHGIAVRIDEYTERGERGAYIAATLFVERESHKPIVIGQAGEMLKLIGSAARQEIEAMSGRKVFLELRVKVRKNWRDDKRAIRLFGFGQKKR